MSPETEKLIRDARDALMPFANFACTGGHPGQIPCHNCTALSVATRLDYALRLSFVSQGAPDAR